MDTINPSIIYVKDDKRYSGSKLNRMQVTDPTKAGFKRLIDVRPSFDKFTHKIKDVGTLNGAIVYDKIPLTESEVMQALKDYSEELLGQVESYFDTAVNVLGYTNNDDGGVKGARNSIGKYLAPGGNFYDECILISNWMQNSYNVLFAKQNEVLTLGAEIPTLTVIIDVLPEPTFLSEEQQETLKNRFFNVNDDMMM